MNRFLPRLAHATALILIASTASATIPSGFDLVINAPPDSLDVLTNDGIPGEFTEYQVPRRTQLNVTGSIESPGDGEIGFLVRGEINYDAPEGPGDVGGITALDGGVANIKSGFLYGLQASQSGTVNISGGFVAIASAREKGLFVFDGGDTSMLFVESATATIRSGFLFAQIILGGEGTGPDDSVLNLEGGETDYSQITVGDRGVVNLSGGTPLGGVYSLFTEAGGLLNVMGSEFSLNGVPITSLIGTEPFEVLDRSVTLTGLLSDGQPFSMDVTESFGADPSVVVLPGARLTLTLAIPEPAGAAIFGAIAAMTLAARRRGETPEGLLVRC